MAFTEFGSADVQTVKRWSDQSMRETFGKMGIRSLISRSKDAVIQLCTDLDRQPGDTVYYDLLVQDRGNGVDGDATLEGFEDDLTYHQDTLKINQKRKGHKFKRMTQQRTVHDLRVDGRYSLTQWFAWFMESALFTHFAGVAGDGNESVEGALGATTGESDFAGNTVTALDSGHLVDNGGSDFEIGMLDDAIAKAQVQNPRVAPGKVDGREMYVAYLHPYQIRSLWKDATQVRSITDMLMQAGARGSSNPIWNGALGMYRNVLIRQSEFVPSVSTVRHGVMLGAGAGVIAFGNAWDKLSRGTTDGAFFRVDEQERDYKNRKGMAVSSVVGLKRCQFNSQAFGVMGLRSTDAAP